MLYNLARYFSIPGFIVISLAALMLLFVHERISTQNLLNHEARANTALTRAFANTIWPSYKDFVAEAASLSRQELLQRPELSRLEKDVSQQMRGLDVIKVKLYAINGLTVYSTDPQQVGDDKSGNLGFLSARAGTPASEIIFRNQMYGFEGYVVDRNMVASYVPIRDPSSGTVDAVFEVYSDVTSLVTAVRATRWIVIATVLAGLLAMCAVFVWRAALFIKNRDQERETAEREMRYQAYHDPLTGLPNRRSFQRTLDKAIKKAVRSGKMIGVMFLDLDRFKLVNDSMGHQAGDALLQEVASRIKYALRDGDRLFRMGGDEFTITVYGLSGIDEIQRIAERVVRLFAAPFTIDGREFLLSTSIGIAVAADDSDSHEELLKRADAAMYRAKSGGRNRYAIYTDDMQYAASDRLDLELGLQRALADNQFYLLYQPRVSTETGDVVGCEALLRWRRPETGVVSPAEFIPVLEDNGLIVPVGRWILREACGQARTWQRLGVGSLRMSVNISAVQFTDAQFVNDVRRVLTETGLSPHLLELEITENVLVEDVERVTQTLAELKQLGVAVSIDDFGTGYSSLSYLRNFPIDYIKIDQSFIRDIAKNERNASITRAIAALASSLGLECVAEGVETEAESDFLRTIGCPEMQGFLFSAPVAADDMARLTVALRKAKDLAAAEAPAQLAAPASGVRSTAHAR